MPKNWVPNFRPKGTWPKHHYVNKLKRLPAIEPVVFQELRGLKLRNRVSSKEERSSDASCLQEMAVMFACLKTNDFKEPMCTPEIESFQSCYKQHQKTRQALKNAEGELVPGAKVLTSRQLNKLLVKYPQYNKEP